MWLIFRSARTFSRRIISSPATKGDFVQRGTDAQSMLRQEPALRSRNAGKARPVNAEKPRLIATAKSGKLQHPMMLGAESAEIISWLAGVVKLLWQVQPRITGLVVGATVLARFTNLAAFLLPLKVLLLAASEGVPRYFSMIADPDTKPFWIIGLSFTAVALYFVTRFLQGLARSLSEVGSLEVMKQANQLALLGNQNTIGRRHFTNITGFCADLLFAAIGLTTILLFYPFLAGCLAVLFAVQYGFTAFVLARRVPALNTLADRIQEDSAAYLQELYTISFWLGFVCILAPFLTGSGGNILLTILCFVLLRQSLRALVKATEAVIKLAGERQLIDALVFPHERFIRVDSRRNFRSLFAREIHLARLESALKDLFEPARPTFLRWQDPSISGLSTFIIGFGRGSGRTFCQEQIFAPHAQHLINNEEVLFAHISRDVLSAPAILRQFSHGNYECRLCDYGLGYPAPLKKWRIRHTELLEELWSLQPPDSLIRTYRASHMLLHERLTAEVISRIALAVSTRRDAAILRAFEVALPPICSALSKMPLHISNSDLFQSNTAIAADGRISVMVWGRWALEPIGMSWPRGSEQAKLPDMIARVRERREDASETLTLDSLRLVNSCYKLESDISRNQYEAALRSLPTILRNPIVAAMQERRPVKPRRRGVKGKLPKESFSEPFQAEP